MNGVSQVRTQQRPSYLTSWHHTGGGSEPASPTSSRGARNADLTSNHTVAGQPTGMSVGVSPQRSRNSGARDDPWRDGSNPASPSSTRAQRDRSRGNSSGGDRPASIGSQGSGGRPSARCGTACALPQPVVLSTCLTSTLLRSGRDAPVTRTSTDTPQRSRSNATGRRSQSGRGSNSGRSVPSRGSEQTERWAEGSHQDVTIDQLTCQQNCWFGCLRSIACCIICFQARADAYQAIEYMEESAAARNEWERERAEAVALPSRRGSQDSVFSDGSLSDRSHGEQPRLQAAVMGVRSAVAVAGQHWQPGRGRDPEAIAAAQAAVRAQRGAIYSINEDFDGDRRGSMNDLSGARGPATWGIERRRASDSMLVPRRGGGGLPPLDNGPTSLPGSPLRRQHGMADSSKKAGLRWSSDQIKSMMDMLPKYHFEPEKHSEDEDHKACAICLDDYEKGDDLTLMPCFHRFHSACVTSWILTDRQGQGCPMCKQSPFAGMQPPGQPPSAPG